MSNPWEKIKLDDYENHMSADNVYQLQTLNGIMREQFRDCDFGTVMILGVAGGNGLEHIVCGRAEKVYGVDVNAEYLEKCRERYSMPEGVFVPICADLTDCGTILPHAELLVANLLIEYIGYECFARVVQTVKPQYVSCVIQINTDSSFVSETPYIHAFDCLESVHFQMDENELSECMSGVGYRLKTTSEYPLPNGKKLVRLDFEM